jgi:STE24 endopeptidase
MSPASILTTYLVLLAVAFLFERGLTIANMVHLRRLRPEPPPRALTLMSLEEYRKSVDYTLDRSRLSLVSATLHAAVLVVLILTGWLGNLQQLVSGLSPAIGGNLAGVVFVYVSSLLLSLVSLPFSVYSQFVIEDRYGFNRMSLRLFVLDMLKGSAVGLVLGTPLLFGLFALVSATPLWWVWAFLGFAAFQFVMVFLYPRVIAPLFNRYTALEEGSLRDRLHRLAEGLGVAAREIYVVDGSRRSAHSNAYFSGFGKARRIVLFDTLIKSLTERQIAAVLAHEIGHQKLHHVVWRIAGSLAGAAVVLWLVSLALGQPALFAAFGFQAPGAPAAMVLLVFAAEPLSVLLRAPGSWWSRRQEYAADRFARDAAGCGAELREALAGLSRDNLTNPTPHPWYSFVHYSHPTVLERVRGLEESSLPGQEPPPPEESRPLDQRPGPPEPQQQHGPAIQSAREPESPR